MTLLRPAARWLRSLRADVVGVGMMKSMSSLKR
jgi:hypothetical protein